MRRILLVALALAGCQKVDPEFCGNNPTDPRCTGDSGVGVDAGGFIIGGKVNMLSGAGLVLQNNGSDDKQILSSGNFTFATPLAANASYDVTVSVQPTNPSQTCVVNNGSGTATGDVNNVSVDCTTASYVVGGTVTGLASGTVALVNNGSDMVSAGNGAFMFGTKVASGSTYTVTLGAGAPAACHVFGASGTVGDADVTTVVVNCNPNAHTIGGTVTNLNGKVQLQDNGGDTITLSANGSYAFPTPIALNGGYSVTVLTQPTYPPASQTCVVSNPTGTVGVTDVTNVDVNCTTNAFHVSGSSTGVTGTIVLQNNGGDDITQTASGPFMFATPVASGRSFAVTVSQTPPTLGCTVMNGAGTIANGDVSNVAVTCRYKDPGVTCGGIYCTGGAGCCDPEGGKMCQANASSCSGQLFLPCDSNADCGFAQKCCVTQGGNGSHPTVASVACSSQCMGPVMCDPNTNSCGFTKSCKPYSLLPGYYTCQ
jgi:hypothetical protein